MRGPTTETERPLPREFRLTGSLDMSIGKNGLQQRTPGGLLPIPARNRSDGRIRDVDSVELRARQRSQETEQVLLASLSAFTTRSHEEEDYFVSSSSSSRAGRGT